MKKRKNCLTCIADNLWLQLRHSLFLILICSPCLAQDSLKFYTALGLHFEEKKQTELAIEAFSKALRIDSLSPEAYYYRGVAFHKAGEYELALKDFDKAVLLDSDDIAGVLYNRGLTKYLLYDFSGACDDWETSGKTGFSLAYDAMNKYCRRKHKP